MSDAMLPAGAGPAPELEFVFEIRLRFTRVQMIPGMPSGAMRGAVYVDSGEISGPRLNGKAVPSSGGDYALFRPDDVVSFDARYRIWPSSTHAPRLTGISRENQYTRALEREAAAAARALSAFSTRKSSGFCAAKMRSLACA